MADRSTIESDPDVGVFLHCECGWDGMMNDVEGYAVERGNDRVVRECPGCGRPVPEWGTLRPIAGVERVAKGRLRRALVDAGVVEG